MKRFLPLMLLTVGLLWSSFAIAADPSTMTMGPTTAGYQVQTRLSNKIIYLYPDVAPPQGSDTADRFPPSATLTVRVEDASGTPVAGVPVQIGVEQDSTLQGMLLITPEQETTNTEGEVQATVKPTSNATTGAGYMIARVDGTADRIGVAIDKSRVRGLN
jgi:hypothetical protein